MLKQFFKLFRNNDPSEDVDHPHIEGLKQLEESAEKTYLEFLFDQVLPGVRERLNAHPTSDPILEVATQILVELFPEHWEEADGPLADERSPRLQPPPPPPAPPASPEASETPEASAEDVLGEEVEEGSEAEEVPEADIAQADEVSDEEAEVVDEAEVIDEADIAEAIDEEADPPAGFSNGLDETSEFEPPPILRAPKKDTLWPARLDDPDVLKGARVFLGVLLDNDRLPPTDQLSVAEILMAADLWIHLLVQDTDVSARVQSLARLVEKKFADGHFSQARLLLQIFPANTETRINNDRQLYYEEMILHMGIRRRQPLGAAKVANLREALKAGGLDDKSSLKALSKHLQVEMLLFTRPPEEVEAWREVAGLSQLSEVEPYVLGVLPPRRWRSPLEEERPLTELLDEHLLRPMLRRHITTHLKTCYFVLRAVGDTGLEGYLDAFFDWSRTQCDVDATRFLPEVYRRTMSSSELVATIFNDLYDRYYRAKVESLFEERGEEALARAFESAMAALGESKVDELAPGQFNLGGFVLDHLLGFEYPTAEFGFKLHRLS